MPLPVLLAKEKVVEVRRIRLKEKGKESGLLLRDSTESPKAKGICHMYVRNGQCSNDTCPYSHLSQDQVKRALGQGRYEKRDQSRGSDEADKGSQGRGKGRGKGKGKPNNSEANLQVLKAVMPPRLRLSFNS